MKRIFFFIFFIVCLTSIYAQIKEARPSWIQTLPKPKNTTYIYRVGSGFGQTRENALEKAYAHILQDVSNATIGSEYNTQQIDNALRNDSSLVSTEKAFNAKCNKVCEYAEKKENGWVVWILCQCPKKLNEYPIFDYDFEGCNDNTNYKHGVAACLSIFIPGSGQMYMRHYGSGIVTLLGEIALVGGGVGTYFYAQKQLTTLNDFNTDYNTYMNAKKTYNNMRIASISCYCAAGVLYIYNIIRAATIKPKFKTKTKQKSVSFYPSVIPTQNYASVGIGMTIKLDKNQQINNITGYEYE